MKEIFYGDSRDLVKWGGALRLAELYKLQSIFQVPYLRRPSTRPSIRIDGHEPTQLSASLWNHFRDLMSIEGLAQEIKIRVFRQELFARKRDAYVAKVLNAIENLARPCLLLLDPDTGLARNSDPEHVGETEVSRFWQALHKDDLLAVYQHAQRREAWQESARSRLEHALKTKIKIVRGEKFASDVILLFARRENDPHRSAS